MTEIDVAKAAIQEADTRYGKPMPFDANESDFGHEAFIAGAEWAQEQYAPMLDRLERAEIAAKISHGFLVIERDEHAETWARAESAEETIERVRALHYPLPNSASAMYPKPLCACSSGEYDECPTVAALDKEVEK